MQDQVIICDLDNTIFDTSSIDPELFASLLHKATDYLSGRFTAEIILSIIQDIVSNPFRQGMREVRIAQINDITCLG